ncbi:response regulator transcription factor [Microscilla marina]|uniref:DNA-binding response regulator, LuxR family, putative n=1 Tax=Microscilla marina ATCC 23134 TaxID=313606 RepID=A1ZW83_MICM2|nr:response regulator transcription factor [Microscilla marina]EAY25321.1 DNA-binding response regulator, LuxR family, putative [Microscilla marina ATCC 23134]
MIKIALAYGEKLFTQLLENFLRNESNIQCLFTALSGKEFLCQIKKTPEPPQVVLLDLKMTDMEGTELIEKLKATHPDMKYILMSSYYKKTFTGYALKTGANALVPKEISPEYLLKVIALVHTKGYYFMEEQIEVLRSQIKPRPPRPNFINEGEFTDREMEVLRLLCEQYTAQEIADKLFISRRTVEGHKDNLFAKTGARNLAGLVIYALQNQLVSQDSLSTF